MAIAIENGALCLSADSCCPLCTSQLGSDSSLQLPCCQAVVCNSCAAAYIRVRIESGEHTVPCPSTACKQELSDEVVKRFTDESQQHRLELLKLNATKSTTKRSCPNCSSIKTISEETYHQMKKAHSSTKDSARVNQVVCPRCETPWCYYCYAPAHPGVSCKQNSDGTTLFSMWTKDWDGAKNQQNAFNCPGCGIPTQRSGGCPNMNCNYCYCHWCYHCGKQTDTTNFIYGTHCGNNWEINACDRKLIFGSKKATRRLRRFKLAQEIFVVCVCGLALAIIYLPLLPLVILLAPPIILLICSLKDI